MKTLVIHAGGVGDFVLTCPALHFLAQTGEVNVLGQKERLMLAVAGGIARQAWDFDEVDFATAFSEASTRLRTFLAGFDRCLIWMRDATKIETTARDCGVKEVQSFPGIPPDDWNRPATVYYLECVDAPWDGIIRLDITGIPERHDVIIHPGSGGRCKNWPLSYFQEIAQAFIERGVHVAWSTGPAEEGFDLPRGSVVLPTTGLVERARILASARLYIGNDSGITHLAAAVGCPTVAIFGPTDPTIWGPQGEKTTVVRGQPWPTPATVFAQVWPMRS